nr:virulence factor TspB C-terminal domain-related protein [Pseudomonas sp. P818]
MNKHLFSTLLAACRRRLDRRRRSTVVGCGFLFFVLSFPSLAEDYYWWISAQGQQFSSSSPRSACDQYMSWLDGYAPKFNHSVTSMVLLSTTRYRCVYEARGKAGTDVAGLVSSNNAIHVDRFGDSCPAGTEYNAQTGECDMPPPECPVGDPSIFKGSTGSVVTVNGANYVNSEAPSSACYEQCSYTVNPRTQSCFLEKGSTNTGFCNYLGESTGENCSSPNTPLGQTGDPLNPPETPDVPPSDPNDPGCPEGWSWSGTTCVRDTPPDPGDGDGDGDDGNPGDGGDSGGSGPGDGGGGGDGDGEGDGGGDGDGGNGGLPGDGEGDGEGECDPSKDPRCAPGSVTGPGCDQPLVCTGDVVSCAILKQQKDMRCHAEEQSDYESKKADIDSLFQGDKFQIEEQNVDVPSFVDRATTFLPRTCPVDERISVSSGSISMSYEPLCVLAEGFSWIFVAFTTVFCAIYVGAAFGGNE